LNRSFGALAALSVGIVGGLAACAASSSGVQPSGDAATDGAADVGGDGGAPTCAHATPLTVDGGDTGFDLCDDHGGLRRREAKACPTSVPRPGKLAKCDGAGTRCSSDDDCAATPGTYCSAPPPSTHYCECTRGCRSDGDCASGQICECGDVMGRCVEAKCTGSASCGGHDCVRAPLASGCTERYECITAKDECYGDRDCDGGTRCAIDDALGHRACRVAGCVN